MFNVVTLNVRGLNSDKLDLLSDLVLQKHIDFVCLQETMISNDHSQNVLAQKWSGPSFWSPAIGRRGGVAILCSPEQRDNVSLWQKDADGRLLSLLISCNDVRVNLVNVYAPTNPTERGVFFQSLDPYFFPNSRLFLAGDFNCYDGSVDKMGGSVSIDARLSDFKSVHFVRDAWRLKHPRERQFTWFNSDLSIASRLDSFLISRYLCDRVISCEIYPCVYSDHDFVFISLELHMADVWGPGVWKFNNSLLKDEEFCALLSDLIDSFLLSRSTFPSDLDMWDSLKQEIKRFSISYSREKRRQFSREKVFLINHLSLMKRRLAAGYTSIKPVIFELEVSLKQLFDRQLEGSKIRSRAKWLEEGEVPSTYFLRLENERRAKAFVSSIFNSSGTEVSSFSEIMEAHRTFYTELFSRGCIDTEVQRDLFSCVSSRLSEPEQASCEGCLTLAKASEALRLSNRGKTPGADGLSVEFYVHFWHKLGETLVAVFNLGIERGELPESMKASITRLIHKKDDKRNLKNWRPISLLNVDYKICSKAVSLRLSKVLGSIVDPDQTCSVPGRSISSNLVLLRDTLAFIERTNEFGILVSLDQEKAFDRVDRSFLLNLLELFGFGPWFRACIATLYRGSFMQVLVNDFLSDPIPLARGVRQGDALSPMLYVLCVEVLACKIRKTNAIEGFLLPGADGLQFKVCQYADDTTAFVKNERSLFSLFEVISLFKRGSGAKLNRAKTEALWLGAWKNRPDQPLGLSWVRKMKILGVFFGTLNVDQDNWEPRISKLDKCVSAWKKRSLSLIGKVLVLNILGLSKLLFVSSILTPPRWVYDRVNQIIWPFLWGSRVETVARRTLICSVPNGGLGLRDFRSQGQALRLATLVRTIFNRQSKCFFLLKYFCGAQLASIWRDWAHLRDNATPSALSPSILYSSLLTLLRDLNFPASFSFSSKEFYSLLLAKVVSVPIFPLQWTPFVPRLFSLSSHWQRVRDNFTENYKNDLAWLITLRATKVCNSLRVWGYITSDRCASCTRVETTDHCFLNCRRVKPVWFHFIPLLTSLLGSPFVPNCSFVFFYQFRSPQKHSRILKYVIKTILYGIWKFRNKATFHNGREDSKALIRYIKLDLKNRILLDKHRLSPNVFRDLWSHPAICSFCEHDNLVFNF